MTLIEKALQLATRAHDGQVRKNDGSPVIVHVTMVGFMLKEHGFDENIVAAGICHDVLEDTQISTDDLIKELGPDVAKIVEDVSENKKLLWEERKAQYAAHVEVAPEAAKAVAVADKIHNAETIIFDYQVKGKEVWKVFNRGKDQQVWFHELVCTGLEKSWNHPLVARYRMAVEKLKSFEA